MRRRRLFSAMNVSSSRPRSLRVALHMSLACIAGATFLTLASLSGAAAGPAAAQTASCGKPIRSSTTLTADVGPCRRDGLIIMADNITLDLGGHTVFGIGTPAAGSAGVHLKGVRGVTVKNGTVTAFATGVAIQAGSGNVLTNLTIHDNIALPNRGNSDFGDGIGIFGSSDNVVSGSVVEHNGPYEGIGVFGDNAVGAANSSHGNRIENNTVKDNNIVPQSVTFSHDHGINLGSGLSGSALTTIAGNSITGSGAAGILACSFGGDPCVSTDNVITGNTVVGNGFGSQGDGIRIVGINGDGTRLSKTRTTVRDNVVKGNHDNGIIISTGDNTITGNTATENDAGHNGSIFDLEDLSYPIFCDNNVWSGNTWGYYYDPPVGYTSYGSYTPECVSAGGSGPQPSYVHAVLGGP